MGHSYRKQEMDPISDSDDEWNDLIILFFVYVEDFSIFAQQKRLTLDWWSHFAVEKWPFTNLPVQYTEYSSW